MTHSFGLSVRRKASPCSVGGMCTSEQTCAGQCPGSTQSRGRPPLCFCDDECDNFNDCCKDRMTQCSPAGYQHNGDQLNSATRNMSTLTFTCMELKSYSDRQKWQILSAGRVDTMKHGYYIVATCPLSVPAHVSQNYRKMCEEAGQDILTSTPFNDRNMVTYKNMFCALCNGVEFADIKSWNIEFKNCNTSYNSTEIWTSIPRQVSGSQTQWAAKEIRQASQNCQIVTEPAEIKQLRRCFPELVSDCPSSYPDQRVRVLCRSYQSVIVANNIYYRNKYCAQCNLGVEVRCNIVRYVPSDIRFYSLRVVADFSKGHYYMINHEGERSLGFPPCPNQDQIFDIFREKCRVINCAKGYLTPYGDCIKIPSTIPESCGPGQGQQNVRVHAHITNKFGFTWNECADMIDWWLRCVSQSGNGRASVSVNQMMGECYVDSSRRIANFSITAQNNSHPSVMTSLLGLMTAFNANLEKQTLPCDTISVDFQQGCMPLHRDVIGAGKCRDVTMNSSRTVASGSNGTQSNINLNVNYQAKILKNLIYVTSYSSFKNRLRTRQRVMACNRLALDHVPCPVDAAPYSDFVVVPQTNGREQLKYLPTEKVIKANQYEITANGTVLVCHGILSNVSASVSEDIIPIFSFSSAEILVSCFGLGLSLISMMITFTTYLVFPSMRNLPGKTVMSLITALFTGQGLFLFGVGETQHDGVCTAIAIILHYSWLSAFTWTNVLAFHLSQSLGTRARGSMRQRISFIGLPISKTFFLYCAYGWGAPLVVVAVCVIVDFVGNTDFQYGTRTSCWITGGLGNLLAFGVPVGLTLLVNVAMFTNIVSGFLSRRTPTSGLEGDRRRRLKNRRDTMVSFKIALLMGFTWLFAYIAAWAAITALWYVFILLNSLQGVYILTAFTCNRGTCRLWKNKFNRVRERCSKLVTRTTNNSSGHRCVKNDVSGDVCPAEEAVEDDKIQDQKLIIHHTDDTLDNLSTSPV